MQIAESVLETIRDRSRRGLPIENIYQHLYNPDLFLRAYGRLYRKAGATTQGITRETTDGMSMAKINTLIETFRCEQYQWTPVKRIYIPKKNGGRRPLGIPVWSDKLVQEVMRSLLGVYYESQFSDLSHGFRPQRGCHSALAEISRWKDIDYFIEGDIKACFDSIDHECLLSILKEKIHDHRFIDLIADLLKAGCIAYGRYEPTPSGTPQGGPISPLLANIYLDRLDQFVENTLVPLYTTGEKRIEASWKTPEQLQKVLTILDTQDSNFRRIRYIRYADDFLIGFTGRKAEAKEIKQCLKEFLHETLKLELSEDKTAITHSSKETAHFLGYEIKNLNGATQNTLSLSVPTKAVKEKCSVYEKRGRVTYCAELLHDSDYDIISLFQSRYIGYVQYYIFAHNVHILNELRWVMSTSLLKTLAKKHKTHVNQLAKQFKTTIQTPFGPQTCVEMPVVSETGQPRIARFGGFPLRLREGIPFADRDPNREMRCKGIELIQRLLSNQCECCGATGHVEVHHIRKLVHREGQVSEHTWMREMIARKRKTLIVCKTCHRGIHSITNTGKKNRHQEMRVAQGQ
ncbi:MAG: hypothetical protein J4F29_14650 [Candidatus Latescibacteria bacterium]|nr:hypothetical protein [Candidatus Latescibacterota bacterium]